MSLDGGKAARARLKRVALANILLAAGFCALFFAAKHSARLRAVTPFVEDPFDAVGSFAIQLAAAAALLSMLRALRRERHGDAEEEAVLITRGVLVSRLAIHVTAVGDIVAMCRHPEAWTSSPSGRALGAFLAVILLGAAASAVSISRSISIPGLPNRRRAWTRLAAVTSATALALALYPEHWRGGAGAAVFGALYGMSLLFVATWVSTRALLPRRLGHHGALLVELAAALGVSRASTEWLNPHRHPWRWFLPLALLGGATVAAIEVIGEGLPPTAGRAASLLLLLAGIESSGILLGSAFFGRILGIFVASPPADR